MASLPGSLEKYAVARVHDEQFAREALRLGNLDRDSMRRVLEVESCGSWLHFQVGKDIERGAALVDARFCNQHKLCAFCGLRHSARLLAEFVPMFEAIRAAHPEWVPYLLTYTIKGRESLRDAFEHLTGSLATLKQHFKDRRRRRSAGVWGLLEGVTGSIEIIRGSGSGLWHPHLHAIAFASREIGLEWQKEYVDRSGEWRLKPRCAAAESEWLKASGDSCVCEVKPFDLEKPVALSACEAFAYTVKMSSLDTQDRIEVLESLFGRRLIFKMGAFRGLNLNPSLKDDPLEGDFEDYFFRWCRESREYVHDLEKSAAVPVVRAGLVACRESQAAYWAGVQAGQSEREPWRVATAEYLRGLSAEVAASDMRDAESEVFYKLEKRGKKSCK